VIAYVFLDICCGVTWCQVHSLQFIDVLRRLKPQDGGIKSFFTWVNRLIHGCFFSRCSIDQMMIWSELRESEGMVGEWVNKRSTVDLWTNLETNQDMKSRKRDIFFRVCKVIHEMWDLAWFGSDLHRFWSKSRFI
jgi:hypothetical protein